MAFGRSATGPPALSINPTSANSIFGSSTTPAAGMFGAANKPAGGAETSTTQGGLFGSTNGASSGSLFGSKPAASGSLFGNTGTSQGGGLFGSTATSSQPATGGLFASTSQPPATGGLFGSTATSQPQTSGGLFGSTSTSQPQATGGLFGGSASTSQPQASGGLFGSTSTSQPQTTGGLFGSATTSQQPQTGSLFGNTNTSQAAPSGGLFSNAGMQNQTSGGLFGNSTSQPAQTSGLFGGLNKQNQTQTQPSGSLFGGFGNTQNQQNQTQPSTMFSQSQQPGQTRNASGGFIGGLTMGAANQQSQPTVPGVRIDVSNIRGSTRFNDLHEDLQKHIMQMDDIISKQIGYCNECESMTQSHDSQLSSIPVSVEFCRRKLIGLDSAMDSNSKAVAQAKKFVETDSAHALLSFNAVTNLKLPAQYHVSGGWPTKSTTGGSQSTDSNAGSSQDIIGFFSSNADEIAQTLATYQKNMGEIEQHLRNVEATTAQQINNLVAKRNGAVTSDDDAVRELAEALTEFEHGVLHVAGKIGSAREGVQSLQLGAFTNNGASTSRRRDGVY